MKVNTCSGLTASMVVTPSPSSTNVPKRVVILSKYPIHEPCGADGLYSLIEVQPDHVSLAYLEPRGHS
jgi:hypothetical protein